MADHPYLVEVGDDFYQLAIRSVQSVDRDRAAPTEDFVLWWAEIAEAGAADLTPATLFQLATVPADLFTNFGANHLQKLWSPLVNLQAVQNQQAWTEEHGALPAWLLFSTPVFLKLNEHGRKLPVYPLRAM